MTLQRVFAFLRTVATYIVGGFVGGLTALWLERLRRPLLVIQTGEHANADETYPPGHTHAGERWKFFRVSVRNAEMPFPLNLVTSRETAENCRATVALYDHSTGKQVFSMRGRWASTPEIPHTGSLARMKTLHPDPVTIAVNSEPEHLDIVAQMDGDRHAYGWNAESYLHNWRHPNRELAEGNYKVQVTIDTQNGTSYSSAFLLTISPVLAGTLLRSA